MALRTELKWYKKTYNLCYINIYLFIILYKLKFSK